MGLLAVPAKLKKFPPMKMFPNLSAVMAATKLPVVPPAMLNEASVAPVVCKAVIFPEGEKNLPPTSILPVLSINNLSIMLLNIGGVKVTSLEPLLFTRAM